MLTPPRPAPPRHKPAPTLRPTNPVPPTLPDPTTLSCSAYHNTPTCPCIPLPSSLPTLPSLPLCPVLPLLLLSASYVLPTLVCPLSEVLSDCLKCWVTVWSAK